MSSRTQPQLLGRQPRRRPNQHRLPPLLIQPAPPMRPPPPLRSTTASTDTNPHNHTLKSTDTTRRRCSSPRNCCSVAAVGPRVDADSRLTSGPNGRDGVSYAVEHRLPKLLNDMVDDMLRERPETDVDQWMMQWFERAYLRQQQQDESQQRGTHQRHPHTHEEEQSQKEEEEQQQQQGEETPSSYLMESTSGTSSAGEREGDLTHTSPVVSCMTRLSPSSQRSNTNTNSNSNSNSNGVTNYTTPTEPSCSSVGTPHRYRSALHAYTAVSQSGFPVSSSNSSNANNGNNSSNISSNTNGNTNINGSPPITMAIVAQRSLPTPQQSRLHSAGEESHTPTPPTQQIQQQQQQIQQHSVARMPRGGGEMRLKMHSAHLTDIGNSDACVSKPP